MTDSATSQASPTRATTVEGIRRRMAGFATRAGLARGIEFRPEPTDILIATYPKAGTTLMQQMVHQLRTGGHADFGEITEVVPWLELAHDLELDLNAPQPGELRAFKSHLDGNSAPRGGRSICIVRDPGDTLVSFYNFFSGWVFEPGSVSLEEFAFGYVQGGSRSGRYWEHLVSWWQRRNEPATLVLCFEDIVADRPAAVRAVARFLDLAGAHRVVVATERTSIDFMRARGSQFDDHLVRERRNAACGLPDDGTTTKVRTGRVGDHRRALTPRIRRAWDREWRRIVEPATGCASYPELRALLTRESR